MICGNILVTGVDGFLGSAIVRQAVNAGLSVIATDRFGKLKFSGVDYIPADILNPLSLSKVFDGANCVCHVAGLAHIFNKYEASGAPFYEVNVAGTKNVAHAAIRAGVQHFIFISSVSVYGGESHGKNEDSECFPEGPYAESKWNAEQLLTGLCQREGMDLTILRLATLYGEEDPGNVARLIRSIDRGRFVWVGKGKNPKSLLHREDAARACVEAINKPQPGINIYNVSGPACTMKDIVETIATALGKRVPSLHIPSSFALGFAKILKRFSLNHGKFSTVYDTLQKWLADDYYNRDKFCKAFDFKTNVSLEEGIKREVSWYKDSGN
ncbi:MAG: NAD-dependent epimerase/dehydratase family protein [Syntrophorhabdaceae bacterium]|nr:NAD-dependent epimerase/dehydratase family protein [Syntrophorhabdaceae bacterium]